jgi:putative hydrolase of the HAD superfamily
MQKISLVLFDMHDVLCRYDRTRRLLDLEALSGKPAAEIDAAIWGSGFETQADSGQLDTDAYLSGFGARLEYPITLEEWLVNRKASITPMPEVLALLEQVTVKTAVLTNNHFLVRENLEFLFPELFALCGEDSYVSAQFGAAKPDPAVYLACAAAMGVSTGNTLFIDDSVKNVGGAVQAGMAGHVFTGFENLAAALRQYGVL